MFNKDMMRVTVYVWKIVFLMLLGVFLLFGGKGLYAATTLQTTKQYEETLIKMNPKVQIINITILPVSDVPVEILDVLDEKGFRIDDYILAVGASICEDATTLLFVFFTPIAEDGTISGRGVIIPVGYNPGTTCPTYKVM